MSLTTSLEQPVPAAGSLTPVLPARWALAPRHLTVCLAFCALFLYLNYSPMVHPGTWLHAIQGRTIVSTRSLPSVDAAQPFTEGMRILDTSWLSDAILGLVERLCGREAVFHVVAVTGTLLFVALAWLFYLQARSWTLVLAALAVVLLLGVNPAAMPVPQVLGLLCLTAMLYVIQGLAREGVAPDGEDAACLASPPTPAWRIWAAIGAIQLVWTNLHASYPVGVGILACYALGRVSQTAWRTRSPFAVLSDRSSRRWILLTEWAAVVTLVNPFGLSLASEVWRLVTSLQVRAASDWAPLVLTSTAGLVFLGSFGVLAAVLRKSSRPVLGAEVLLWTFGAIAVAITSRALAWYAVIFVFAALPHAANIWAGRTFRNDAPADVPQDSAPIRNRFGWTLACVVAVWVTFCLSPISSGLLGRVTESQRIPGSTVPRAVAERLRQASQPQTVFAPLEWADWLTWDQAPKVSAMMTSNVQWVPQKVWSDYQHLSRAELGWEQALERYHVDCLLVHTGRQPELARGVRLSQQWQVVLESGEALVALPRHRTSDLRSQPAEPAEPVSGGDGDRSGLRREGRAAGIGFSPRESHYGSEKG